VEAAAVLLAFPLAVALTVLAISPAPAGSRAAASPTTTPAASAAARVAIVAPEPVAAYTLADRLVANGYEVTTVDTKPAANSLSASTVVVYYERERQPAASRLRDLLGTGTIRRDQALQPGSDLIILLGKDLQRT
jgi:hypothetical protein